MYRSDEFNIEPRLINNRCTACGLCAQVCPESRPLKPGRSTEEKAAYIQNGLAFPMKYSIDPELCKGESCGKCLEVCEHEAIQLNASPTEVEIQVDKVVLATGWSLYDPALLENYGWKEQADVLSNLEFEHLLAAGTRENSRLVRPSDGKPPRRIAFVQCAGSRDMNHLPYCSSVCCSASLKHALSLQSLDPEIHSEIFYIDMRLSGRNERLLKEAGEKDGISLTKGKVGRISKPAGQEGLVLEVEDIMKGTRREEAFDLVVLAMGLTPNPALPGMNENEYGFYLADQKAGIIPTASCKAPMDVSSAVKDATASALKAMKR